MSNRKYLLRRDSYDERDLTYETTNKFKATKYAPSVDLRSSAPSVFDQKTLGSCSANSGVAAEMMREKKVSDADLLSRLDLYYNERSLEGTIQEDSGATIRDICVALQKYGVCPEADFPYGDGSNFAVAPSDQAVKDALDHRINQYHRITTGVDGIKAALANSQPVLVGMAVYSSMETDEVAQSGILPMPSSDDQELGGHAVLCIGYLPKLPDKVVNKAKHTGSFIDSIKDIFEFNKSGWLIIRNSWGEEWGDKGYFYMPYEYVDKDYAFDFWVIE